MKHKRDMFDEMFDHPELTMRRAYWKVNGRRYIIRWLPRILWIILIMTAVIWLGNNAIAKNLTIVESPISYL